MTQRDGRVIRVIVVAVGWAAIIGLLQAFVPWWPWWMIIGALTGVALGVWAAL
jgi:hypothetical protein